MKSVVKVRPGGVDVNLWLYSKVESLAPSRYKS
jgi:hypothetical protein